jgi:hypothetical protein
MAGLCAALSESGGDGEKQCFSGYADDFAGFILSTFGKEYLVQDIFIA